MAWTTGVVLRAPATLAAGATANHAINLATLGARRVEAVIDIAIGSSTGVTVEIHASADGGTSKTTTPLDSYAVTGSDARLRVMTGPWREIRLTNNDGTNATGNIGIIYAWSDT